MGLGVKVRVSFTFNIVPVKVRAGPVVTASQERPWVWQSIGSRIAPAATAGAALPELARTRSVASRLDDAFKECNNPTEVNVVLYCARHGNGAILD